MGQKPIQKLGIHDSINHALFISQLVMELLLEKGIITQEEVEDKYAEMLQSYSDAVTQPNFEVINAEEFFKNLINLIE